MARGGRQSERGSTRPRRESVGGHGARMVDARREGLLAMIRRAARVDSDPVVEAYKRDVDRTLLRRNLQLTPEERLLQLEELQRFAAELRRAGKAARARPR